MGKIRAVWIHEQKNIATGEWNPDRRGVYLTREEARIDLRVLLSRWPGWRHIFRIRKYVSEPERRPTKRERRDAFMKMWKETR